MKIGSSIPSIPSNTQMPEEASLSITKKAMDVQEQQGAQILKLLESAAQPYLGKNLNINA